MEMKPSLVPRIECLPHGLGAMRVQIIPDHVHLLARIGGCHTVHESHQVVLGAPVAAASQYPSGMNIQRGNQRLGTVTDIFKFPAAQPSGCRGTPWMLALDGLDAGLLVNTQYHRILRRLAVQLADHIDLLAKRRIRTMQPLLHPMRANVASLQDALHMAATDLFDDPPLDCTRHNLIERRRGPTLRFLHFTRQCDQLQPRLLRDARRTTTALCLPNPLRALPRDALAPLADGLHGHAQFLRDRRARVALVSH